MNDITKQLLAPIQADLPCGPDLGYDPALADLLALAAGKPEIEIGSVVKPAEPPDWPALAKASRSFLERSRHLNVAVIYACCLLKLEGVEGLREGLGLLQGLLENYWAGLYPALDPEDHNDPTQRLNILGSLNASGGGGSWWITFIDNLYAAEICRPKGLAPVTFRQLLDAKAKVAGAPDADTLIAAIRAASPEVLAARQQALTECLAAAQGIDQYLTATLGAGTTISFEVLQKTLRELLKELAAFTTAGADAATAGDAAGGAVAAGAEGGGAAAGAITINGSIRSRDDVERAIERICDYYAQVEPGSPIPYILKRVKKMAKMNFVQIIEELSLAKLDDLKASMGSAVEPPPE